MQAENATPGYSALAFSWFTFTREFWRGQPSKYDCWGIIDNAANNWAWWEPAYAYKQWSEMTRGAQYEGYLAPYTRPWDTLYWCRTLQFADSAGKRFWIAWNPWHPDSAHQVWRESLAIPSRSDILDTIRTAIDDHPPTGQTPCELSGWLTRALDSFPIILKEHSEPLRPDLQADSIRLDPPYPNVGMPLTVHVRFHNAGNAPTPDADLPEPGAHPTWVVLRHNGDSVAQGSCLSRLYPGDTGYVSIHLSSVPWYGHALFEADVNPGQRDVELGMDDNAAYKRVFIPRYPTGVVDAVVPPGGKTDAALLPIRLTSHSWETDSITGQTPADSARILFAWYGQRDSVVHTADTTAWFPFCTDTALQFPRGCGKFKVYAQFRDSGADDSPVYPDSADTVVVFDSVPAVGSIVINTGARFAPSATCTLRLAAHDSASGVYAMRFSNRTPVNLVRNGAFVATGGSWSFTGGGYDSSLQMGLLTVSPSAESKARQFVPVESISAHYGDSCVLEASILAHMHGGSASGDVSFSYFRTRADTMLHDTVWLSLGSASYSGDVISLTGRYNLAARFLLASPTSYPGWVWRGGMVQVRAQGVTNGTGHVWTDNVSLNLFQAQSGCAWWGAYDTLAAWGMGSTAGQHVIRALLMDYAGAETGVALADTVILDPTAPTVHVSLPQLGQLVSNTVEITGWGYDPIEVTGDTWFASRRLSYRHQDSTNWLPVTPDSVSHSPAYPNWNNLLNPAVHLGYWNTNSLPNGNYWVRLRATDSVGHLPDYTTWVVVSNGRSGGGSGNGPGGGGSGMGSGSVYVGSATGKVLHLSDDLDSLGCIQVTDSGSQAYVTAILEVGNDSLLVLDARNKRIHKLHRNGQNRRRLVSNLSIPCGITRDDNGNFWLVDKGIHRIGKFRRDGTLVFTRGGQGQDSTNLNAPEAIAVKGSLVYVADTKNDRIAVWDTSGNYIAAIKGDFENPTAVMVTDSGTIYLTDGSDGRLKGITPLGGSIVAITASDSSKLRGLVLSENKHSLFTLAPQPNVVHKFRIQSDDSLPGGVQSQNNLNLPKLLTLNQPFPNPARTRLNISYALPRQTRVSVKLYDIAGKLTTTLASGSQKPGYYHVTWNRQDARGRSVPAGVYFCTLVAEGQRFSRKVVLTE